MANTKISALTAGAPAVSTDLIPIDRAGANYSLQVSDMQTALNGAAIPASKTIVGTNGSSQIVDASAATLSNNTSGTAANLSGTPALPNGTTATTQAATDSSTNLATTAAIAAQIVDGVPAANSIAKIVASRVLVGQSAVDGAITNALYAVPVGASGVYRVITALSCRTQQAGAWVVDADVTWPAGIHQNPSLNSSVNLISGTTSIGVTVQSMLPVYLHAGDVIQCGTVTGSGTPGVGTFDVAWVVERLV